jgi:hypothetical protein
MKNMKKLLVLAIVVLGFATSSFAQGASAQASASGTIVSPISIVKDVDMNFGNIAVNASVAGTVVLSTDGTRAATAGVTLPAISGTVAAAEFTVNGTEDYTYVVTLPIGVVTVKNGGNTMDLSNWTSNQNGILTGSTETFNVGATLNVNGGQAPGIYTTTTPFTVTVNYN